MAKGVVMSPTDFHHVLGDDVLPADPYRAIANGSAAGKAVLVMSTAQAVDMMPLPTLRRSCWLPTFHTCVRSLRPRAFHALCT